jgi:zeaxanthin glucosyltransferase
MVAIPVGYDQPGVAARIAYHGVGEFIELGNLTTRRLSELIAKIKENLSYRDKAGWFQKVLTETRGLDVAADIIERVFEDHFEDKTAVSRTRMLATSSAEETSFLP